MEHRRGRTRLIAFQVRPLVVVARMPAERFEQESLPRGPVIEIDDSRDVLTQAAAERPAGCQAARTSPPVVVAPILDNPPARIELANRRPEHETRGRSRERLQPRDRSCRLSSLEEDSSISAGDESRHISEHARQSETARICEIPRRPHRVEFVFERSQPLEVVDGLPVLVQERRESVPQRRSG